MGNVWGSPAAAGVGAGAGGGFGDWNTAGSPGTVPQVQKKKEDDAFGDLGVW